MARLILINGAPGSGKSTLAHRLAQETTMALALDIDGLKHALGRWEKDPLESGLHARRLALALTSEQLAAGFNVVIGQYLARTPFIENLERLAGEQDASFFEFVLHLDAASLAMRLARRASTPDRHEHAVNNRLIGPEDASDLVRSIEPLRESRPRAVWVDATGSLSATLRILRTALDESATEML